MTTMIRSLLIISCTVLTTCSFYKNKKAESDRPMRNEDVININIDQLNTKRIFSLSSVFKQVKLIPLETNENCLLGTISNVELFDDTLYVLDEFNAKALFVFDLKGKFIRKIGRRGKGPGEYRRPTSFSIDAVKREIFILNDRKILVFNLNGTFLKQINIPAKDHSQHIAVHNGIIYVDYLVSQGRDDSYLVIAIDESGEILRKWLPFQSYIKGFEKPLTTSNHLFKTEDGLKYARSFLDTIFCVRDNELSPYIVLSTKNKINKEEIRKLNNFRDAKKFSLSFWGSKKFLGINDYEESSDLIMFRFQNKGVTHQCFYWKKSGNLDCTTYQIVDDLTFTEGHKNFYSTEKNWFISSIDNKIGKLDHLIENIKANKFHLPEEEMAALRKLTPESNPVIVLYECREEMKSVNN